MTSEGIFGGPSKTTQRTSNKDMEKCDFDVTKRKKGHDEVRARDGISFVGRLKL